MSLRQRLQFAFTFTALFSLINIVLFSGGMGYKPMALAVLSSASICLMFGVLLANRGWWAGALAGSVAIILHVTVRLSFIALEPPMGIREEGGWLILGLPFMALLGAGISVFCWMGARTFVDKFPPHEPKGDAASTESYRLKDYSR